MKKKTQKESHNNPSDVAARLDNDEKNTLHIGEGIQQGLGETVPLDPVRWETQPFDLPKIAEILNSEVESYPYDIRWWAAIQLAERDQSLDPLITYLRHPATQPVHLKPGDCVWLRRLFERMQIKRKKRGRFTPLWMKSAEQRNWIGAQHVRELMRNAKARGEKLTTADAIDRVARIYRKSWFTADGGKRLANYIKKHGLGNIP